MSGKPHLVSSSGRKKQSIRALRHRTLSRFHGADRIYKELWIRGTGNREITPAVSSSVVRERFGSRPLDD
jgi:hypothetical protein